MNITKISKNIQNTLNKYLDTHPPVLSIIQEIDKEGGKTLLVGGAVRDLLLRREMKDLDLEVHGLPLEKLQKILRQFGKVSMIGKSFGVLRLHGLDVDFSLPRKDSAGRKPKVKIDPFMSFKDAFSRRDLTINAMGIDLVTYDLIDPFDGYKDLAKKVLRAPDKNKFIEDPLRFYRVMQFISRFEMEPDAELNEICKKMDISEISMERIEAELHKLMLKSKKPSLGIRWLKKLSRLSEVLPEVADTVDIQQESDWHPEGDVFEHLMQCIDAAAALDYENDIDKLKVMYATLCHDLGKAVTTENIGGRWKSIGHAKKGVKITKNLLSRFTRNKDLAESVEKMVRHHMAPIQFVAAKAKPAAYKRLARKLAPHTTLDLLAKVSLADKRGRNPMKGAPLAKNFSVAAIEKFLKKAKEAKVEKIPEPPILFGRDLMGITEPGPRMGEILKKAYEIQIERGIRDKQELKKIVFKEIALQNGEKED